MTAVAPMSLLARQVPLIQAVLELRRGMGAHLVSRVTPHLGAAGRTAIQDLLDVLDAEDPINPKLAEALDTTIAAIRAAIAAGTTEEQVAIPRTRLIGCAEAFETRTARSPAA